MKPMLRKLHKNGYLVLCPRYQKCVFKKAFYQLKTLLVSRKKGIIKHIFRVVVPFYSPTSIAYLPTFLVISLFKF